ncbi:hypothetical protein EYF80_029903 [Liparis tanakae]|uniref:Uncharacterized protein n=1 Tax=Liparis tanakae TaxID=230148 RepID=A0A4Z2H4V5_9TELE|nr:hypothetical protein EYF80_029903 [Liparis tanakae]
MDQCASGSSAFSEDTMATDIRQETGRKRGCHAIGVRLQSVRLRLKTSAKSCKESSVGGGAMAGVVDRPGKLDRGVGKQIRVGLGDLGARLMTGRLVKVLQPRTVAGLVGVSLGGRRQRGGVGQLGGQAGEFLPGGVHQMGLSLDAVLRFSVWFGQLPKPISTNHAATPRPAMKAGCQTTLVICSDMLRLPPFFPGVLPRGKAEREVGLTEEQADRWARSAHTQAGDSCYHHGVADVRQQARQQDGQNGSVHRSVDLLFRLRAAAQTPDLIHMDMEGYTSTKMMLWSDVASTSRNNQELPIVR